MGGSMGHDPRRGDEIRALTTMLKDLAAVIALCESILDDPKSSVSLRSVAQRAAKLAGWAAETARAALGEVERDEGDA